MYRVMKGMEAWRKLTDEQRVTAEIKVGDGWKQSTEPSINDLNQSTNSFVKVGGYDLPNHLLVMEGCEFRIPGPQEWIIGRTEEKWNYSIDGRLDKSLSSVLALFPVGTKFKMTVMEEGK